MKKVRDSKFFISNTLSELVVSGWSGYTTEADTSDILKQNNLLISVS